MRIGVHKVHNRFPYILHYLWPRLLNGITRGVNDVKIYKWLWWFIELPAERNNKVTGKTLYNTGSLQCPFLVVERFADNGEHSHWVLVNRETGEEKWSQ